MRGWDSLSQVWLHRSIECLQEYIAFVASLKAGKHWSDDIPGFNLSEPEPSYQTWLRQKLNRPADNTRRFRNYIKQSGVNKLLIHFAEMAVKTQASWQDLDVDVFVYCHGFDVHFDAQFDDWPYAPRHPEGYVEQVLALAQRVTFIANSQHTRQKLLSIGVPLDKICLVYYGVELPLAEKKTYISEVTGDPLKLLFLGRLVDFKGPDLVIKAFDAACHQGLNAQLTIAGDGNLMPVCQLLAHDSQFKDRIHFVGPVGRQQAAQLFSEADVFINHQRLGPLSNREEAFGVTMIEAMAYGLPVVTARSGGVQESVIDNKTGYLIKSGNTAALVDRLLDLASSPEKCQQLGQQARQHVLNNFSLEKQKATLLSILASS